MGFLDSLLGGGIDSKLKHLDKLVEDASYDVAEESLLDLRGACAKKYPLGSAVQIRLDLAEARLRVKYHQFDRADSPARRAHAAAKGLGDKDLLRDATEQIMAAAVRGGRLAETVDLAEQWIAVASPDFRQRVDVLITKGNALNQLGRFNDALRAYESAIRLVDAMPDAPDKHERFVTAASGMGDAYLGQDDRVKAIDSWRQAMAATRIQFGDDHPQVASILVCIGTVQLNADEIESARNSFGEAIAVFRASGHSESLGAAVALQNLALTHLMKGEVARAAQFAKEALAAATAHGPELRAQVQELQRKIEDTKNCPMSSSTNPHLLKPEADFDEIPLNDRTMFPPSPMAARPTANRPARSRLAAARQMGR